MPVWPFLMGATALLTIWGAYVGAWRIPALALIGYIAVRGVMPVAPPDYTELAISAVWLTIAAAMVYVGGKVPSFFLALSALSYPAFLLFGQRLEYMGPLAILADAFAILALLAIGGGLLGMVDNTRADRAGVLGWFAHHSLGVARSEKD